MSFFFLTVFIKISCYGDILTFVGSLVTPPKEKATFNLNHGRIFYFLVFATPRGCVLAKEVHKTCGDEVFCRNVKE